MNLRHVKETIRLKMKGEAPALFRQLERQGQLEAYLDELADDVKSEVVNATLTAGNKPALLSPQMYLQRLQTMEDEGRRTLEVLLAELEFPVAVRKTTDSGMKI